MVCFGLYNESRIKAINSPFYRHKSKLDDLIVGLNTNPESAHYM